jgi:hypothetical protein
MNPLNYSINVLIIAYLPGDFNPVYRSKHAARAVRAV